MANLLEGFRDLLARVQGYLPAVLGALGLLLVGWLLARLLGSWSRRLITTGLERIGNNTFVEGALRSTGARATVPTVAARFVFWVVFLFFVAAAVEALGLPVVTTAFSRVAYYLPNVLAAVIVLFGALIAANLARAATAKGAQTAGVAYSAVLGRMVYWSLLLVGLVVAVEQLGIQGDILVVVVAIVFGTTLASAGLAFALGARTAVSNIIAAHYVTQVYHVGQTVRIGDAEGRIVETTPTAVLLETAHGRQLIPANRFGEESSILLAEST